MSFRVEVWLNGVQNDYLPVIITILIAACHYKWNTPNTFDVPYKYLSAFDTELQCGE